MNIYIYICRIQSDQDQIARKIYRVLDLKVNPRPYIHIVHTVVLDMDKPFRTSIDHRNTDQVVSTLFLLLDGLGCY